jgi:predicted 3-demethylubiquinone-9 3-methyltransferase (glyoxalase superfamily)
MSRVATCLWFERDGEDAAKFYVSLLPNSEILATSRYGEGAPLPAGTAIVTTFTLDGSLFQTLNGGAMFAPSEAASIVVHCETQDEIDRLWAALTADGGKESMCGWLKDRWGVSWQIVPRQMEHWMTGGDSSRAGRVMSALMQMRKLDIRTLEAAFQGP